MRVELRGGASCLPAKPLKYAIPGAIVFLNQSPSDKSHNQGMP